MGTDTESGQKAQGSLDWASGKVYSWKVVNSGTGSEVLEIRDAGTVVLSLNYPSGMDAGNALELQVSTNPSIGSGTTIAASIANLNGNGVSGALSQTGTGTQSAQALYYYFPPMAQGFTAEGTVSLTYPANLPSGSRVQFTVRAGTIPCTSTNTPPTVSITAPAANTVFNTPATITVTANAQDTDGTVTQVVFYANGIPIGTATASPFTIQWANVPAGAYSLTAVATDNGGLTTTSAAVPIAVNAIKALYFIHVDHLNTPRQIYNEQQQLVWRWDQAEPFGDSVANEDPDGNSVAFSFPQRFPGQYYDAETLLHYNYFRDYDPSIGRYAESDPIGLLGGVNSYAYVIASPLSIIDLEGDIGLYGVLAVGAIVVGGTYYIFQSYQGFQQIIQANAVKNTLYSQVATNPAAVSANRAGQALQAQGQAVQGAAQLTNSVGQLMYPSMMPATRVPVPIPPTPIRSSGNAPRYPIFSSDSLNDQFYCPGYTR